MSREYGTKYEKIYRPDGKGRTLTQAYFLSILCKTQANKNSRITETQAKNGYNSRFFSQKLDFAGRLLTFPIS